MPTIDSDLRLVLPLRTDDAGKPFAWAYHTPLSVQAFEASYRILAAAKGAIFSHGGAYAYYSGVHVAALHLRDAAKQESVLRGEESTAAADALLADLRRLTMITVPGPGGWESVPLDVAQQRGAIDAEDVRDLENGLVFFTCNFHLTTRARRKADVGLAASTLQGSITSLPLTEWIASLPRSIPDNASMPAI